MTDDNFHNYCRPNKLGITDAKQLEAVERELVNRRMLQKLPSGDFDMEHLKRIHKHLFQDVYDWAGEIRNVELQKVAGHEYMPRGRLGDGMQYLSSKIKDQNYLRGMTPAEFAERAAELVGEMNFLHPFREGNGRAQRVFISELATRAGHQIDWKNIDLSQWLLGRAMGAHGADYRVTKDLILLGLAAKQELEFEITVILRNESGSDIDSGTLTIEGGLVSQRIFVPFESLGGGDVQAAKIKVNWVPKSFSGEAAGSNGEHFSGNDKIDVSQLFNPGGGAVKLKINVSFINSHRDA